MDTFARMRQLVGTSAEWSANDLVVGAGEFAIETISPGRYRMKIGDGVSRYSALENFDPSVTTYVDQAGDQMTGPLIVPELHVTVGGLAAFAGPATFEQVVDLGDQAQADDPASNDNSQRVPTCRWVQQRVGGIITGLTLKGTWNATTNSPTLANGVGARGDFYIVSVAGNTPLDGVTGWQAGDSCVFNGVAWQRVPQTLNQAQIVAGLGYTPVNRAGDTMSGPLNLPSAVYKGATSGQVTVTAPAVAGAATAIAWPALSGVVALVNAGATATNAQSAPMGANLVCGTVMTAGVSLGPIGAAGERWELFGRMAFADVGGGAPNYWTFQLWNGAAAVDGYTTYGGGNGLNDLATFSALVTLAGPTTFSLRAQGPNAFSNILADGTRLTAKRLA
jgi:hypothetical protein